MKKPQTSNLKPQTSNLLKVILKILRDTLMQMGALMTAHVMGLAGIHEEIRLCAC